MTMLRKRVLSVIEDGGIKSAEEIYQIIVDRMVSSVTIEGVRFALNRLIAMGRVDKYIVDGQAMYQITGGDDED